MKKFLCLVIVLSFCSMGIVFANKIANESNITLIEQSNKCLQKGKEFYDKYDSKNAEIKYKEAIKLNPKNADAYYYLGSLQYSMGFREEAIKSVSKAISINKNNDLYYILRAMIEISNIQSKSALEDLNKAIEINSKNGDAYILRAHIRDKWGDTKNAIKDMDTGIKNTKYLDEKIYGDRAYMKVKMMDYDGAIADYNIALEYAKKQNNPKLIEYYKDTIKDIKDAKQVFKSNLL